MIHDHSFYLIIMMMMMIDDHFLGVNNDNTRNQRYCIITKLYIFKYMCLLNCTILFYSDDDDDIIMIVCT